MQKDIRFLLIFLVIAIGILVWAQSYQCVSNNLNDQSTTRTGSNVVDNFDNYNNRNNYNNFEHFQTDNKNLRQLNNMTGTNSLNKKEANDEQRSIRENKLMTSKIVDKILQNSESNDLDKKSRFFDRSLSEELSFSNKSKLRAELDDELNSNFDNGSDLLTNPLIDDVNTERDSLMDPDQKVLDKLIKEVNTGNDLVVDNARSDLYRSKARSINSAKKYRNISYKDSDYRYDFNEDGSPSQTSQDELNSLYDNALVFRNNEYNSNGNFTGMSDDGNQNYGNANLNDFKPSGPQTQQEKIMQLYNSNEYLPNNSMLDKQLTKGFQILDNPVAVSNPNLIPVLKSIPVSSTMGSNKNQTYDIRAEPPCPKTVVSPFLNSSIMPDIYSTQRGCL